MSSQPVDRSMAAKALCTARPICSAVSASRHSAPVASGDPGSGVVDLGRRRPGWKDSVAATRSATAVAVVTGARRVDATASARRAAKAATPSRHVTTSSSFGAPGDALGLELVIGEPESRDDLRQGLDPGVVIVEVLGGLIVEVVGRQGRDGQATRQLRNGQADLVELGGHGRRGGRGLLVLVVQAHHEVVPGPRHPDVEQAVGLERVERTFAFVGVVEPERRQLPAPAQLRGPVLGPQHRGASRSGRHVALEPGQDDDGELEPLRPVDGHDPHGVVVGIRWAHASAAPVVLGLELGPGQERAQRPTHRLVEEPGLVHEPTQPLPVVAGSVIGEAELEAAQLLEDPRHHGRGLAPPSLVVQARQHRHGLGDRMGLEPLRVRCGAGPSCPRPGAT